MNPGIYNLLILQYATYAMTFVWSTQVFGGAVLSNNPVDLTGYTAVLQIRPYVLSATLLYDASGDIVLGGPAGTIALTIPDTVTGGFTWSAGVYDLLLISPQGVGTRLVEGGVTVVPGVSVP